MTRFILVLLLAGCDPPVNTDEQFARTCVDICADRGVESVSTGECEADVCLCRNAKP